MVKFIKIISTTLLFLVLTSTVCFATDINMNLQNNTYSNSESNTITNSTTNTSTTVPGHTSTISSTQENVNLTASDIINILLIVVGVVLILLGIAILIRIHSK